MKTNHYLTTEERERILDTLSEEQKEFLLNDVKQRVRSKFANAVAMDEWELVDYVDAGRVNPDLRCECGRSLRYQYVIKDLRTDEIKK